MCSFNLGNVKEELMEAMGLNTEEAGSTMAFLRRGYKVISNSGNVCFVCLK